MRLSEGTVSDLTGQEGVRPDEETSPTEMNLLRQEYIREIHHPGHFLSP